MRSEFTPEESAEFIRLLQKIQQNEYWIPSTDAWKEVQKTFSRWALELVIVDKSAGAPRVLLTRYEGAGVPEHRHFFHIPGGFNNYPESIQETCSRVAMDELGIDVTYEGVLGVHKWHKDEHPWGSRLLSIYAKCEPKSPPPVTESQRFFSKAELNVLDTKDLAHGHPQHDFLNQYLSMLESGDAPVALTLGL